MSPTKKDKDQLERKIVALLQQENEQAVSLIYQNYADTLYGLIRRIISSETIAQEVLQDAIVKIWKNASQYDANKGRLFTWFANIARNTAIDRVRSANYKKDQKTDSVENFVNKNELGSEEIKLQDTGLRKVINSLDEKHRMLIDLAYFQGYSQREIEKELGIPLGTIKTRIRSAIKELRVKLGDDFARELLTALLAISSSALLYLFN